MSNRYFFNDVPVSALWGAPGLARSGSIAEYYGRCASGHPAARLVRRPQLRRQRRRGPGPLGRRASPRRRADRPGVHGRRGARLHGVAAVQERRALHHLRRVGRLLRARGARRASPTSATTRDINKDFGLMGWRIPTIAVSPYARRRPRVALHLRLRVDPEDDRVALRPQAPEQARPLRRRTSPAHSTGDPSRASTCPTCRAPSTSSRSPARATPTTAPPGPTTTT